MPRVSDAEAARPRAAPSTPRLLSMRGKEVFCNVFSRSFRAMNGGYAKSVRDATVGSSSLDRSATTS